MTADIVDAAYALAGAMNLAPTLAEASKYFDSCWLHFCLDYF